MAKYQIVGPRAVAGVLPGGVVEFDPDEAAWLIEAGHLAAIATKSKTKAPKVEVVDDNQSDPELSEGGEQ